MGKTRKPGPSHRPSQNGSRKTAWLWAAALASAFVIGFFLYSPAMNGPFLFDDAGLPFAQSTLQDRPLSDWVSGVRPVLMFSYWVNRTLWGDSPVSYHAINVLIHVLNAALVFLALRRLLALSGWTERIAQTAAAGALVFLIHPLQTESVSYIAGRSESLAAFFMLLAYVVFLYRPKESISWMECIVVLALFALAVKTKENAVSLAGILFLTDVFWPAPFSTRGLRRNWRLYALMDGCGRLGIPRASHVAERGILAAWRHLVSVRLYAGAGHLRLYPPGALPGGPFHRSRLRGLAHHLRARRHLLAHSACRFSGGLFPSAAQVPAGLFWPSLFPRGPGPYLVDRSYRGSVGRAPHVSSLAGADSGWL
jgi:hypothetical protein